MTSLNSSWTSCPCTSAASCRNTLSAASKRTSRRTRGSRPTSNAERRRRSGKIDSILRWGTSDSRRRFHSLRPSRTCRKSPSKPSLLMPIRTTCCLRCCTRTRTCRSRRSAAEKSRITAEASCLVCRCHRSSPARQCPSPSTRKWPLRSRPRRSPTRSPRTNPRCSPAPMTLRVRTTLTAALCSKASKSADIFTYI